LNAVTKLCLAVMVVAVTVVADMVILFGRYGLWPKWLWPMWFVADMVVADMVMLVADMVCGRYGRTPTSSCQQGVFRGGPFACLFPLEVNFCTNTYKIILNLSNRVTKLCCLLSSKYTRTRLPAWLHPDPLYNGSLQRSLCF